VARIVARRPVIGLAAGLVFGALGRLLIGMERAPAGVTPFASILFSVAGYFFLFVAAMAFAASFFAFLRAARRR
jgi:hypothetical protein